MAVWSEVPFNIASKEQRFGSEFWMPQYLKPLKQNRNWTLIGDLLLRVQYGISQEMNSEDIGIPIYRMNEMDGVFLSHPSKSVEITAQEYLEFKLSVDDVLFNRTNSYKYVGRTGILKDEIDAVFASYLIRLVPDTSRLLPEYLTVYLNTPTGIGQVRRRAMESINQANVSGSEIKKVPIPLFSIAFQRKIAELVNEAASLRRQSIRKYDEAESILLHGLGLHTIDLSTQNTYIAMFSEFVDAERLDAEYFQPKYYKIIEAIHQSGYYKKLGAIIESIRNGFDYRDFVEEGTPYIRVGDVRNGRINLKDAAKVSITQDDVTKDVKLRAGDILFTRKGSFGNAAVVRPGQEKAIISSEIMLLRLQKKLETPILPDYLALFLNSNLGYQQVQRRVHGGAFYSISQPDLAQIELAIPPAPLQERLAAIVQKSLQTEQDALSLLEEAKRQIEQMILNGK